MAAEIAARSATVLAARAREADGSRAARRLRRSGLVPGIVYGGGEPPVPVAFPAGDLRHALAGAGAVIQLEIEGAAATPVVVKELARHPVSGETVHVDLLRVRMDRAIQSTVTVELTGAEDAPGVREGGVLEHVTRELVIEALPGDIPDTLTHDVSAMVVGDTLTLAQLQAPAGVQILGDPETVIATLTPPRLQAEPETELEAETELVGETGSHAAGQDGSADAGESAGDE
jgi:large subunit ribosomal protein L25